MRDDGEGRALARIGILATLGAMACLCAMVWSANELAAERNAARAQLVEAQTSLVQAETRAREAEAARDRYARSLAVRSTAESIHIANPIAHGPSGEASTLSWRARGEPINEIQFLDADIAEACSGAIYMTGTPTMIQHNRELRRFREEVMPLVGAGPPGVICSDPNCGIFCRAWDVRPCPNGHESPWVVAMRAVMRPQGGR